MNTNMEGLNEDNLNVLNEEASQYLDQEFDDGLEGIGDNDQLEDVYDNFQNQSRSIKNLNYNHNL